MITISLIIPTLNRYDLLTSLLDGIARWPTQPDEIVIIDQTAFVLGPGDYPDLSDSHRNIRHLKADFRGPCKARNTGAVEAKGDLLWFLDDDMSPDTEIDLVAHIRQHFQKYPRSVLTARFSLEDSAPAKMTNSFDPYRYLTRNWCSTDAEYRFSLGVLGGNVALERDFFLMLGGFDEAYDPNGAFEDRDFGLRCFYQGVMVYQASWLYLKHLGAVTGGRRANPQGDNLFHFWSKQMDEEMYYIQAFSYWLSRQNKRLGIHRLLKFFVVRILHNPSYNRVSMRQITGNQES